MCPEVADKAYPGEEASPTGRAEVVITSVFLMLMARPKLLQAA